MARSQGALDALLAPRPPGSYRFSNFQLEIPLDARYVRDSGHALGVDTLFFPLARYQRVGRQVVSYGQVFRLHLEPAPSPSLSVGV